MTNDISDTKCQCKNVNSEHQCLKGTIDVWNAYQQMEKSLGHDNIVEQGVTDDQIMVISHGRQAKKCTDDEHKEKSNCVAHAQQEMVF